MIMPAKESGGNYVHMTYYEDVDKEASNKMLLDKLPAVMKALANQEEIGEEPFVVFVNASRTLVIAVATAEHGREVFKEILPDDHVFSNPDYYSLAMKFDSDQAQDIMASMDLSRQQKI